MARNYKEMKDYELVLLYREGDEMAQAELVYRYRGFSVLLGQVIYDSYKKDSMIELNELVTIGIYSLHIAVISMDLSEGERPLLPYWKEIAKHNMIDYVVENFIFQNNRARVSYSESLADNLSFSAQDGELFEDEIYDFLEDPKNKISKRDQKVFKYYLTCGNYVEVAKKFNVSFAVARRIIEKVRGKLMKDFFGK